MADTSPQPGPQPGPNEGVQHGPARAALATRAILHIDGVAFSRLLADGDETRVLEIHRDIREVKARLSEHGARIHGTAGDSVLATFDTVTRAIDAALAIQFGAGGTRPERVLEFRVGVHVGDVHEIETEVMGNAVNIAARLQAIADPGGVCISRAARDIAPPRHAQRFQASGTISLKNIAEPVEVFRCLGPAGPSLPRVSGAEAFRPESLPSVLVRPVTVLSADPFHASLGLGFASDLTSRLSRFHRLDVIARRSSAALAEEVPDSLAAAEVGARYVVRTQLQIMGLRMRVSVFLVDAKRDRVMWSEIFDRGLDDIFAVQAEIAEIAVAAMAVHIDANERAMARARDPESLDAYALTVLAWQENLEDGATGREATARAQGYFSAALARNRDYAGAVAGLARTASVQWRFGWSEDPSRSMQDATELAIRAVDIDAAEPLAHSELGFVTLYRREHDRCLAAYERALELNPSDAEILAFYADALKHAGDPAAAIPVFERALRLNPLKPDIYLGNKAHAHFLLGDFEEAVRVIRRMRQPLTAQRVLTASLMLAGREEEGRHEAERLRRHLPGFSAAKWSAIVPDRLPEHSDLLREGLERAGF